MTRSKILVWTALVVVAAFTQRAIARQPKPQLRVFAIVVPTPDTPAADLTSSDSTLLIVSDHESSLCAKYDRVRR